VLASSRVFARAFNWSSVRFLSWSHTARAPEWDAMTAAFVIARMSQNAFSAMWDTSTIMPRRFISATTWRPKGDKPLCSGSRALEESAI